MIGCNNFDNNQHRYSRVPAYTPLIVTLLNGSYTQNAYIESFNGKLRDELLYREIFYIFAEANLLIEKWRKAYNQIRPHCSLGYRPPAPETF